MKKFAALFVALAAGLTACGSTAGSAATFNGTSISERSLRNELTQIRDNKQYRDAIGLGDIQGTGGNNTFSPDFTAEVLTRQIYYGLVVNEDKHRNLKVTSADLSKARKNIEDQLSTDPKTQQATAGLGAKILAKFSSGYVDQLVRWEASVEKLQADLEKVKATDAQVKAYYDSHKSEFDQVCVKSILLDTKDNALKAKDALAKGQNFADLAVASSKDPSAKQNKGDLGCASPDTYVPQFAAAAKSQPIGVVGDPVQSQYGWHLILVYDRKTLTLAEATDQIRQTLTPQGAQAVNAWLAKALSTVKVTVNPKYGSFVSDSSSGQLPHIQPPAPPVVTFPPTTAGSAGSPTTTAAPTTTQAP